MASSGEVYSSYARNSCLYVHWSVGDTDIVNNRKRIDWTAGVWVGSGNLWYSNAVKINSIYIDGGDSLGSGTYSNITSNGYHQKLSGSKWVDHRSDGTKGINVSISGWFYSLGNVSGSGDFTLDTIPRASGVSVTKGYIGSPFTISISSHSTAFTHKLWYEFGNDGDTIEEETAATSVQWTPDIELCEQIPSALSGRGKIYCDTYNDGKKVGDTTSCDLYMEVPKWVQLEPNSSCGSVTPFNEGTVAASIDAFVQGYSKAEVTFIPENIGTEKAYGATPKSYYVVVDGARIAESPYRTGVINTAGAKQIECYVVDTRNRTTKFTLAFDVLEYSPPTLSDVSVFRCDQYGNENDEGTYIAAKATAKYSELSGNNNVTLDVGYVLSTGSVTTRTAMTSGVLSTIGNGLVRINNSYKVEIRLVDSLNRGTIYTDYVPTAAVFFQGGEGGTSAGFGKPPERGNVLDVAWDLHTRGDLYIGEAGKKVADFVVDEYVKQLPDTFTWQVREWNNGKIELWNRRSISVSGFNGDNNLYYSEPIGIGLPVEFGGDNVVAHVSTYSSDVTWAASVSVIAEEQQLKFIVGKMYGSNFPLELHVQIYVSGYPA